MFICEVLRFAPGVTSVEAIAGRIGALHPVHTPAAVLITPSIPGDEDSDPKGFKLIRSKNTGTCSSSSSWIPARLILEELAIAVGHRQIAFASSVAIAPNDYPTATWIFTLCLHGLEVVAALPRILI